MKDFVSVVNQAFASFVSVISSLRHPLGAVAYTQYRTAGDSIDMHTPIRITCNCQVTQESLGVHCQVLGSFKIVSMCVCVSVTNVGYSGGWTSDM